MGDIIDDPKHDWLLEVLYNANKTDTETYRVYQSISRYIFDARDFIGIMDEIAPGIIRVKPLTDLADDCFFSTVFFKEYLHRRSKYKGFPDVEFYIQAGRSAYSKTGFRSISKNWYFWDNYINQHILL